jgi:hypothetical protein
MEIEYCNTACPYFYHNYYDCENIYCSKLDKKIFEFNINDQDIFFDMTPRLFPDECPLEEM